MADNKNSVPVTHELRPAFYDDFHCIGADCQLNCCKGWEISFSKKDFLSLRREEGSEELRELLGNCVRRVRRTDKTERQYGQFDMSGGICPLQTEEGLCRLQIERGPDALPEVCRVYPRNESVAWSGFMERSLSPSCEAVLQLLWDLPDGVEFRCDELPLKKTRLNFSDDAPLKRHFGDVRNLCIDVLQDRRIPLPRRILLMGVLLRKLAEGEMEVPQWLETAQTILKADTTAQLLDSFPSPSDGELARQLVQNISVLVKTCGGSADANRERDEIAAALGISVPDMVVGSYTVPQGIYLELRKRYDETFGDKEYFMENLMVALLFHLRLPYMEDRTAIWKSYVNFCNLYSFYRFMATMSCRDGGGDKNALFRTLALANRGMVHNIARQHELQDEFFANESDSLAHMAILLGC